jgi:hypothetical protein
MPGNDVRDFAFEIFAKRFNQENRTMLSAGTSDGNRQITSIIRLKARRPTLYKLANIV